MLNRTTLARPYARAALSAARDANELSEWSHRLALAAEIAGNEQVRQLGGDPRVGGDRMLALMSDVAGDRFNDSFINFLRVIITNDRLSLLPEIAALYEQYRREAEAQIRVEVISARPLDDEQASALAKRLKARFDREVDLHVEVDESLVGGAIIRAGDMVIDGSVRGRLRQLERQLGV
ncbi:MAG TPA: F0F1 ATP synthase subunit delta [Wenzhouxiangella sp.]|nr:F0F1 ATP synthase subunit delta [Wenzhouxiangella sp.]